MANNAENGSTSKVGTFIRIFNRDISLSSINSVFMNKDGYEIVLSLNHISSSVKDDSATGELVHWYLENEQAYKNHGAKLISVLQATDMFIIPCSSEGNRLDIVNKNNISYIKYDYKNSKITFNFKNSIYKKGSWVSDFIHWKFSNTETYCIEESNVFNSIDSISSVFN